MRINCKLSRLQNSVTHITFYFDTVLPQVYMHWTGHWWLLCWFGHFLVAESSDQIGERVPLAKVGQDILDNGKVSRMQLLIHPSCENL